MVIALGARSKEKEWYSHRSVEIRMCVWFLNCQQQQQQLVVPSSLRTLTLFFFLINPPPSPSQTKNKQKNKQTAKNIVVYILYSRKLWREITFANW